MGHFYTYGGADAYGRMMRMRGHDVFQPMGFDAFGIHSENYALKVGQHPAVLVPRNIQHFREQLSRLGAGFDWSRQVDSTDPKYYCWTQWIFVQLFKGGLAYRAQRPVNWCPSCLTTLASEQVIDGHCERCRTAVVQRDLTQWFFRTTAYAEALLDFSGADFPAYTQNLQRNWIGRRAGARITFEVAGQHEKLEVFSTRADTLFGATLVALAPEHPLIDAITTPERRQAVADYRRVTQSRSQIERQAANSNTGVNTGAVAINPINGRRLMIFVADYVLGDVGTGAVFGTPAHDQRDFEFAQAHGLPIEPVVLPVGAPADGLAMTKAYEGEGTLIHSGHFDGISSAAARDSIVSELATRGLAEPAVSYRLHDWTISRQRYWGPPIPMLTCERCGVLPVPEADLPVLLPPTDNYRPLGDARSPLALIPGFVEARCPQCGGPAHRETDVSDNFLDSAWYYMRYLCTEFHDRPWSVERLRRWLPVSIYFGGREHTTMHHLYARFLWKALQDLGHLPHDMGPEPFAKLRLHGMIIKDGAKMSKSRGNVVNPDEYVQRYGADALRLYMLFMGPFERGGDFRDNGINGMTRFLARVWRLASSNAPGQGVEDAEPLVRAMHAAIKKVSEDMEALAFNTAISALMTYVGEMQTWQNRATSDIWRQAVSVLLRLLAPLAPHLAEELWQRQGGAFSVHRQPWPDYDPALAIARRITLVVEIDGRVRDRFEADPDLTEDQALVLARASERVQRALANRAIQRIIYVPDRLINLVTSAG